MVAEVHRRRRVCARARAVGGHPRALRQLQLLRLRAHVVFCSFVRAHNMMNQ
jgi:hypothetical protein